MNNDVMFSSQTTTWSTPQPLFDTLNKEFAFTLDVCADTSNHKCKRYFNAEKNGLLQSWAEERCYCNPPYGKQQVSWIKKCYEETSNNNDTVAVMLIPSRTDTKVFHEIIAPYASQIRFIKGRVKFSGHTNAAPFPSCVVVFDNLKSYSKKFICVNYK